MSIEDTFDCLGKEIISAKDIVKKIDDFPKTMIVVFSYRFFNFFLEKYKTENIGYLSAGGQHYPILKFEHKGSSIGFFHTIQGGASAAAFLEELIALGAEKLLYFGSCGALDKKIAEGHLLIPTYAYRDEGVSYHYAKPSDYIKIESATKLIKIFDDLSLPYYTTKTWTTDAFYRETELNFNKRKLEGCGVVEMECASIMSVAQFRGKEVYQFLYAADCLDNSNWDQRILGNMPSDMREKILLIAIEVASRL